MGAAFTQEVGRLPFEVRKNFKLIYLCQFLGNGIWPLGISIHFFHQVSMPGIETNLDSKLELALGHLLVSQSIDPSDELGELIY